MVTSLNENLQLHRWRRVHQLLSTKQPRTTRNLAGVTQVSTDTMKRHLRWARAEGYVQTVGFGNATAWELKSALHNKRPAPEGARREWSPNRPRPTR